MNASPKQPILKPLDLLVTLKVAVNKKRDFLLTELASELHVAVSQIHGSIIRAEESRLLSRATGTIRVLKTALKEFVVHGARYSFPGQLGAMTRGMPTSIGGPILSIAFEAVENLTPVWPDPDGGTWGPSLTPLHPSVPLACKSDLALYDVLSLFDAIRIGAAREREIALKCLDDIL